MPLLIDAYNVLHCTHTLPERYAVMDVSAMCVLIERSRWSGEAATVVCDGVRKPTEGFYNGPVELVYAGSGRDADSVIEKRIDTADNPRQLIVVSNDRRIIRAARRRRCRQLSSEDFLQLLVRTRLDQSPDAKPDTIGTPDAWMREFDLDDTTADRIDRDLAEQHRPAPPSKPESDEPEDNDIPEIDIPPRIGDSETDYWLREFGFGDEDERERDVD